MNTCVGYVLDMPIPRDVYLRSRRLREKYGRQNYLMEWYEYQLRKLAGT
jgi:hypothetical protein